MRGDQVPGGGGGLHTHTAGRGPGVRPGALSANVKCFLFRETFHSLSLASKDFGPRTIVFPSLMNSDALLPMGKCLERVLF